MRSCSDCPGAQSCAGNNLHPVLKQVYDLFSSGMTDKFEILDALDDASEELLDRFNHRISPDCWSKAALLTIAEVIADTVNGDEGCERMQEDVRNVVKQARNSFERFPWQLSALVEQAPDLYQAVLETCPDTDFQDRISKRQMVKICKDVAYS